MNFVISYLSKIVFNNCGNFDIINESLNRRERKKEKKEPCKIIRVEKTLAKLILSWGVNVPTVSPTWHEIKIFIA